MYAITLKLKDGNTFLSFHHSIVEAKENLRLLATIFPLNFRGNRPPIHSFFSIGGEWGSVTFEPLAPARKPLSGAGEYAPAFIINR